MENERKVYFSAETKIDWDTYKEIDQIRYKKMNVIGFICIILLSLLSAYMFVIKALSLTTCIVIFEFAVFLLLIGIILKKQSVIKHGQQKIIYSKDIMTEKIEFSDKIYVQSDCQLDRSFDYALIEKLYESENYYILMMPFNVALLVDKSTLKGQAGVEFRHFIFDKCYSVKEPLFKKVKNGQKNFKGLTILTFFVAIVVLMLYFFQITPENWRELGRNPQYSSSQQSTNSSSDTYK